MAKDTATTPDAAVKLLRLAGLGALAVGALTFVAIVGGLAFDAPVPPPLHHANLAVSLLQLGLGAGVASRKRAPWAFLIACTAVITVINILGLPELLRASDVAALVFAGLVSVEFVLLLLGTSAVRVGESEAAEA